MATELTNKSIEWNKKYCGYTEKHLTKDNTYYWFAIKAGLTELMHYYSIF